MMKEEIVQKIYSWLVDAIEDGATYGLENSRVKGHKGMSVNVYARLSGKVQDYKDLYLNLVNVVYGGEYKWASWDAESNSQSVECGVAGEDIFARVSIHRGTLDGEGAEIVVYLNS